jgi:hypothetical protein
MEMRLGPLGLAIGSVDIGHHRRVTGKRRRNPALLGGAIYRNGRAEGGLAGG